MARIMIIGCCLLLVPALWSQEDANVVGPAQAPEVREVVPFVTAVTIHNPYDRAIRISRVDSTCSCTTLALSSKFILPHGTSVLHVSVDDHNRSGAVHQPVTLYLSDPSLDPLAVSVWWRVRPCVAVDDLSLYMDASHRPTDLLYRDVYKYVTKVRPDELSGLHKRILLSSPRSETPPGGLKILAIAYAGTIWAFDQQPQPGGGIVIRAHARAPIVPVKDGLYKEAVVITTNHPDKSRIALEFVTLVSKEAGRLNIDPAVVGDPVR